MSAWQKSILFYGAGKGKTFLADSLAMHYRLLGVPVQRESLDSVDSGHRFLTKVAEFSGFVVMDTNLPVESFAAFNFWQTVEVQGGSVLKHGDFFDTATAGLGL